MVLPAGPVEALAVIQLVTLDEHHPLARSVIDLDQSHLERPPAHCERETAPSPTGRVNHPIPRHDQRHRMPQPGERASKRTYRITRRIDGYVETIDAPSDYVVKPGDTVFVYERFF